MNRIKKENLQNIQTIFEEKTGVILKEKGRTQCGLTTKVVLALTTMLLAVSLCGVVYGNILERKDVEKEGEYVYIGDGTLEENASVLSEMLSEMRKTPNDAYAPNYSEGAFLIYDDWVWPTVSDRLSTAYGKGPNGVFCDHINIKGEQGDDVYAVAEGKVIVEGYSSSKGYHIVLEIGNGVTVEYGHLKDIYVELDSKVVKGEKIGTVGATGMATGPNLYFKVCIDNEAVDPLMPRDGGGAK